METLNVPFQANRRVEQPGNPQVVLGDMRQPEDRFPIAVEIIPSDREAMRSELPRSPLVRVIHAGEAAQLEVDETKEEELLTFGEGVTLLIAIGVLIYSIYALLWPERF